MNAPRGHTLLELVVVLSLLGLVAAVAVGVGRAQADALAVQVAREEVAGLLREARGAARAHGGARVIWEAGGPVTLRVAEDSVLRRYHPGVHGVEVRSGGARDGGELVYGPLGLGRAASLTLEFRRGRAARSLVVSSYGRVRRGP